MKKILIWREIVSGNELDIFEPTNYKNFYKHICATMSGNCPNWGNKLWFQGIYAAINTGENEISFRKDESVDQINHVYDLIIYPMANFFGVEYIDGMYELSKVFSEIKIPVFIIACGAQADNYDELGKLVEKIGDPASRFIETIYRTGGEFALRGNFTKAFFDALGYRSAVVTGCPSMYQLGPELQVSERKSAVSQLKPIINGKIRSFQSILKSIPESVFIDQDIYFQCLFNPEFTINNIWQHILYDYNYTAYSATLLGQERIKMIADMSEWFNYIKREQFNYSFGSRIHGNIMSILAGIPATVVTVDTRTQEMADFFDIPTVVYNAKKRYTIEDLYQAYEDADYSKFNQTFKEKYRRYKEFFQHHGITSQISTASEFFDQPFRGDFDKYVENKQDFSNLARLLRREKIILWFGKNMLTIKNMF